jgi:hypothetical protein
MNSDQRLITIGIYLNSTLYLLLVFAAGIVFHEPAACKWAIITALSCIVCYQIQLWQCVARWLFPCVVISWIGSIVFGLFAALSLAGVIS